MKGTYNIYYDVRYRLAEILGKRFCGLRPYPLCPIYEYFKTSEGE